GGLTSANLSNAEFDVWTGNLGIRITPSTQLSFNSIIQYDNQSEQLGLNNRLRYILKPGRDVYVVFNKGYDHMDDKFRSFQTETITKLGWTFQF
ncbi:MAG: hypothetical protein HN996_08765, partial [Opitutae bacterium]|nr:hypothetical protein [Opitutae bacterium]